MHRNKQFENRQLATNKYNTAHKDIKYWLDTTDRRVNQLQPIARDLPTLQIQLREVKPISEEIVNHEAQMETFAQLGNALDNIIRECESSAAVMPHIKSTLLGQERKPGERLRPKMAYDQLDRSIFEGKL